MTGQAEIRARNGAAIGRALGWYFLLGCAIALALPESLAGALPGRVLDPVVPGIAAFAALTPFPETARVFMVAMWLLAPVAAVLIARAWHWNERIFAFKRSDQWVAVGVLAILAAFAFAFLFFFPEVDAASLDGRYGRGHGFMRLLSQYRVSFGLLGSLWFCIIAALAGLTVRLVLLMTRSR